MRRTRQLLRLPLSRNIVLANVRHRLPGEKSLMIYTSYAYPYLIDAREANSELDVIKASPDLQKFLDERLPYMIFPQFKNYRINVVLHLEFFRESRIFQLTCLDPREWPDLANRQSAPTRSSFCSRTSCWFPTRTSTP